MGPLDVSEQPRRGAYGLTVHGTVDDVYLLRIDNGIAWPGVSVRTIPTVEQENTSLGANDAVVSLMDAGTARFRRSPPLAEIAASPELLGEYFTHPFLAAAGAVFAHWHGHEGFHAGAVAENGRAVMVIGEKGAGKTTSMAWLARQGFDIVADDLVVVEDGARALAGPRCLDLRAGGRDLLGLAGSTTEVVREGDRFRLRVPDVPAVCELAGSVVLKVGAESAQMPGPGERLQLLREAKTISLAAENLEALLDIAALPMVVLTRPLLPETLGQVEQAVLRVLRA